MRAAFPVILLALAAGPGDLSAQDRIDLRVGDSLAGSILEEDYREVRIKVRGGEETSVPAAAVVSVLRDGTPESLRRGRAALNSGDLSNAVSLLQLAVDEAEKPWVQEYASYYLGEALRLSGSYKKAEEAYRQVLATRKDSRFMPAVHENLARLAMARGDAAGAVSMLEEFLRQVDLESMPRIYSVSGRLLLGKAYMAQERYDDAAAAFQRVAGAADNQVTGAESEALKSLARDLAMEARQEEAAAYVALEDYSRARSAFREISSRYKGDPRAEAVAMLGEAQVDLARKKYDQARVTFTELLAVHQPESGVQPKAHLLLAKTYLQLAEQGERGAKELARSYLNDLIKHYPNSDSSAEGRKLLEELE